MVRGAGMSNDGTDSEDLLMERLIEKGVTDEGALVAAAKLDRDRRRDYLRELLDGVDPMEALSMLLDSGPERAKIDGENDPRAGFDDVDDEPGIDPGEREKPQGSSLRQRNKDDLREDGEESGGEVEVTEG